MNSLLQKRGRSSVALLLALLGWPLHAQYLPSEPAGAFGGVLDAEQFAPPEERRRPLLPVRDADAPFRYGNLVLRPRISYQVDYGDGVQTRPGREVKTTLQRVAPGITVEMGPAWTFEYLARWNEYSSDELRDTLDHSASFSGMVAFNDWYLTASHRFASSAPVLLDTARQTDQETHNTSLAVSRRLTERWSAELVGYQNLRFVKATPDVYEWSAIPSLTYRMSSSLDWTLSCAGGYVRIIRSPDSTYVRPQIGLLMQLTDKLSLSGSAGVEFRQFIVGPAPDMTSPVYNIAVNYQPFSQTTISADLSQQLSPAYFSGQTNETTQWSLNVRQRVLGIAYLTAGYTRGTSGFIAAFAGLPVVREDDRETYRFALEMPFLERGRIAVSYRENYNDSTIPGFDTSTSVIGGEISWRY